jgi:hypothetical protein
MLIEQGRMNNKVLRPSGDGDSTLINAAVSAVLMIPAGMLLLALWLTRRKHSVSKAGDNSSLIDQQEE